MRKYKTKLKRPFVEGLQILIDAQLTTTPKDQEYHKMYLALLCEIKNKIYDKLAEIKPVYSFSFSPAQAFALRICCGVYGDDAASYMGNRLRQVSAEIHQHYS